MFFFLACNKTINTPQNEEQSHSLKSESDYEGVRGVPAPDGSQLNWNEDNSLSIKLPNNYTFIILEENQVSLAASGPSVTITCTCTDGNGDCNSVAGFGQYFCAMGKGCKTCTKDVKGVSIKSIEILGVLNENHAPIQFLVSELSNDEIMSRYETTNFYFANLKAEIFDYENAEQDLLDLYSLLYDGNIPSFILNNEPLPTSGYTYLKASYYGNLVYIPVSVDIVNDHPNMISLSGTSMAAASCSCKSGNSGCKLKTKLGAKYCEAESCKSCSLTI